MSGHDEGGGLDVEGVAPRRHDRELTATQLWHHRRSRDNRHGGVDAVA